MARVALRAEHLAATDLERLQVHRHARRGASHLGDLAVDSQASLHVRDGLVRRSGGFDLQVGAAPVREVHHYLVRIDLCWIMDHVGAHPLADLAARRRDFKGDDPGCPGGLALGRRGQADGPLSIHDHRRAGPEPARPLKHTVVGHAGRLDRGAHLIDRVLVAATDLQQVVQGPTVLGPDGNVLGKSAVDGKADLFQVGAVVGIAVAAGAAVAAPDHLFGGDHVAYLQVLNLVAHPDDLARELVAEDRREPGQAGIQDIVLRVGLVKVHVRPADAAGLDPDQHLVRPDCGIGRFLDLQLGVTPYRAAGDDLARSPLPIGEEIVGPGVPICREYESFHDRLPPSKCGLQNVRSFILSMMRGKKPGFSEKTRFLRTLPEKIPGLFPIALIRAGPVRVAARTTIG